MDTSSDAPSAAPEWVRALQAALHADMEADDGQESRGKAEGNRYGSNGSANSNQCADDGPRNDVGSKPEGVAVGDVEKIINDMLANDNTSKVKENSKSLASSHAIAIGSETARGVNRMTDRDASADVASQTQTIPPRAAADADGSHNQTSRSAGSESAQSVSAKSKDKKVIGSYGRLVINTKNFDTSKFSPPVTIGVKDNLGRIFSRDSGEVTLMKKKLSRYITALQAEVVLVQKSVSIHVQHMAELAVNLKDQELQLKRWALGHLFRTFQLQAWLRHSRCEFVVFMVKYILSSLQEKLEDASIILKNISMRSSGRAQPVPSLPPPYDLEAINSYCLSPEAIMLAETSYVEMHHRLLLMDKLCHRSLHKFKTKLPDLESKPQTERMEALHALLLRYSTHLKNSQPFVRENDRLTWDNFIIWSMKRQSEQTELEKEYLGFVEDERETEGRLFRRWCILMNPKFIENELNILTVPIERERAPSVQSSGRTTFNGDNAFVNPELASLLAAAAAAENVARQSSAASSAKTAEPTASPMQKPGIICFIFSYFMQIYIFDACVSRHGSISENCHCVHSLLLARCHW